MVLEKTPKSPLDSKAIKRVQEGRNSSLNRHNWDTYLEVNFPTEFMFHAMST